MKAKHNSNLLNEGTAPVLERACCGLALFGMVLALALLAGCASKPMGGSGDPLEYNAATGYPAVGGH
jgi:hypothetical protein